MTQGIMTIDQLAADLLARLPVITEEEQHEEFNRPYPQYDARRFAAKAREMLDTRSK